MPQPDHQQRFLVNDLPVLARQAHDHWKRHRPTMYQQMLLDGSLREHLLDADQTANQEMSQIEDQLVAQGSSQESACARAREIVLPKYILLPSEEDDPILGGESSPVNDQNPIDPALADPSPSPLTVL